MGADMWIEYVILPDKIGNVEELVTKTTKKLNEIFRSESKRMKFLNIVNEFIDLEPEEMNLEYFLTLVTKLKDSIETNEVTYILVGNKQVFLTGGMSYGDQPTDAGNDFYMFNTLLESLKYFKQNEKSF